MSPFEIFLDAKVEICRCPEWDAVLSYPQVIHLAHDLIDRASMHLGIRLVDGYDPKKSVTDRLIQGLEEPQSLELQITECPF